MPDNENKDFYLEEEGRIEPDEDNGEISESEITAKTVAAPKMVKLFRGDELTIGQLTEVTYRFPASKIYILGEHDSGKTTILATLFEMFQFAPFHGLYFAGSLTQVGFEKRCFHSRLSSKNEEADTERTKTEEFRYLHIAVKSDPKLKQANHFLISDISGEKIKRAKSNTNDMQDLSVISDASHVSYIIDGSKLIDIKTRQAILSQAKTFIRKALDEKIIFNHTNLSIVVSKWDLLEGDAAFNYQLLIEDPFTRDFKSQLPKLTFLKIAVRPKSFAAFKLGHGLNDLLNLWNSVTEKKGTDNSQESSTRMINNLIF
jgi:hypothetical protein